MHSKQLPYLSIACQPMFLIMCSPFKSSSINHQLITYSRYLGVFCYPYTRPYNTNNLQPRSLPCVFLGYNLSHKGYLCLHPSSSRIYITRNVVFDESIFPFHHLDSSPSPLSSFQQVITLTIPISSYFPTTTPSFQTTSSDTDTCIVQPFSSSVDVSNASIPSIIQVTFFESSIHGPIAPPSNLNCHPMITRSKAGVIQKNTFLASTITKPTIVKQALTDPN